MYSRNEDSAKLRKNRFHFVRREIISEVNFTVVAAVGSWKIECILCVKAVISEFGDVIQVAGTESIIPCDCVHDVLKFLLMEFRTFKKSYANKQCGRLDLEIAHKHAMGLYN